MYPSSGIFLSCQRRITAWNSLENISSRNGTQPLISNKRKTYIGPMRHRAGNGYLADKKNSMSSEAQVLFLGRRHCCISRIERSNPWNKSVRNAALTSSQNSKMNEKLFVRRFENFDQPTWTFPQILISIRICRHSNSLYENSPTGPLPPSQ